VGSGYKVDEKKDWIDKSIGWWEGEKKKKKKIFSSCRRPSLRWALQQNDWQILINFKLSSLLLSSLLAG